jgi:pimeloyl-ACP methyl ester carboxylesterase
LCATTSSVAGDPIVRTTRRSGQTFVDELAALRDALGLDRVHFLGHSWGGMLGLEHLLTRPRGVQSLVLSSVEQRLGEIAVPTLILSGRYDEATPAQQQTPA